MANIVKILWSKITGHTPSSLVDGQIAINQKDKKLFYLDDAGVIQSFDMNGAMAKSANGSDISNIKTFRANLGVDKITSNGDSIYTILSTDKAVVTSATLTASRTWTLPSASAVNAGYEIIVADLFGGVTSTNTLVIARAGSDTINGGTSMTIGASYGMRRLISDGSSKWTFDAGVMRISDYIGTTLTALKAVVTDANSKLAPSATTAIEIGYLSGVTSAIQTQLDSKVTPQTGQIIVTSGTSFTTPSNITTSTVFNIQLVGAGGGGGGALYAAGSVSASGGGGGGYCFIRATGLTPSTTYTCAIGVGGSGGIGVVTSPTDGGNTTLTIGVITYTANGGKQGVNGTSATGGVGGTASNGNINIPGQNGDDSATVGTLNTSGRGGSSPKGFGSGGSSVKSGFAGFVGNGYGGGGSGGKSPNTTGVNVNGGAGTNGIIFCQWFN